MFNKKVNDDITIRNLKNLSKSNIFVNPDEDMVCFHLLYLLDYEFMQTDAHEPPEGGHNVVGGCSKK